MSNRRNDEGGVVCYDCSKCENHDALEKARTEVHMAVDLINAGAKAGLDMDMEGYLSGTIIMLLDKAQKDLMVFTHG